MSNPTRINLRRETLLIHKVPVSADMPEKEVLDRMRRYMEQVKEGLGDLKHLFLPDYGDGRGGVTACNCGTSRRRETLRHQAKLNKLRRQGE
jgi:hypothetical protein